MEGELEVGWNWEGVEDWLGWIRRQDLELLVLLAVQRGVTEEMSSGVLISDL